MKQNQTWAALMILGLSAAILAVVGCYNEPSRPPEGASADQGGAKPPKVEVAGPDDHELLANFPKKGFAGALVVTGQMVGYLEPCGCAAKQKGGLVRRAAFLEKLKQQGWDLAMLDLGTLADDPAHARGGPEQAKIKFATSLQALMQMSYDAVALSAGDLRLGTAEALMQYDNAQPKGQPGPGLTVVAANVQPTPGIGWEKWLRPSVRTEVGPVKVGVTAVLDPAEFEALADDLKSEYLSVQTPEESLPAVLSDLEKDTQVQVLMVQGPPELALKMARAYPGFEIIVGTSQFPDPPKDEVWVNDGQTMMIQVGKKGMYLGVVGLYQDEEKPFRYQRVELNDRYDSLRSLAGPMVELIGPELQDTLKAAHVLESFPKRPFALFDTPGDATYVGAQTCKQCHPGTFAKWSQTKHAHAYEVLVEDPHQPGRNREYDAACITCHTTGFEYVGGFVTKEQTPHLLGNQCENCHGPGSKHAEQPDDPAFLQAISREAKYFEKNPDFGCVRCHDEDNDPKFSFATYWPKIMHKGLDSYDDPKVHQGIDARKAAPAAR